MAENFTLARPYAKAIFEQAIANNQLDEWEKILHILAAIAEDPQVTVLLNDPSITQVKLAELFFVVLAKQQPNLSEMQKKAVKNFLHLLIVAKRIVVLPEILQRYQQLMVAARALKEVTVTSAYPLDTQRRENLTKALTQYLRSKVTVDFQEDATLIGGVMIRCGNWVMDSSIKGKLQFMQDSWK